MIDKFKNNFGFSIAVYIFSNLAFTTFSGYQIKTYDIDLNQIITKPRQINLGDLNDKFMPFLYSYKLTRHSEILLKNGDRVEFGKKINFLETCLCENCSKKTQISLDEILYYYDKNKDKILKGISKTKYEELFSNLKKSFCNLEPIFPKKDENGLLYELRID